MPEINTHQIKENGIRRQWDPQTRKWYFSIVDIIDVTTLSTDPRNYWKVLKNRLKNSAKKEQNELVSRCNQLKMRASDGKYYLTDTGDEETILELLRIVSPEHFPSLKEFLSNLGNPEPEKKPELKKEEFRNSLPQKIQNKSYPQESFEEEKFTLLVDAFCTNNSIIVKAFIAGVSIENISITATRQSLTIAGERRMQNKIGRENYMENELCWGKFSRVVKLPYEVNTNEVEATEDGGLLIIKLPLLIKISKVVRVRTI